MEVLNVESIESLSKGIKKILSKGCCSFSEEEKVLLINCVEALEKLKQILEQRNVLHIMTAIRVIDLLLRVFVLSGHIKDNIH